MNRPRLIAVAVWLATFGVVLGLAATALRVSHLGVAVTTVLGLGALLVALLVAGAVVVRLRPRLLAAAACRSPEAAGGCGACGQACLKASA